MCKFLLQFVLSLVFAFLAVSSMFLIRESLAFVEFMWRSRIIGFFWGYPHFMIGNLQLGLPLGSLLGIWIANKCLSRASTFSMRGAALSFALSFLGILLLFIVRCVAEGPAGEVNALLHLLRNDLILLALMFISAGLLATIGYNLGARGAHSIVLEVPPKAGVV